MSVGAAAVMAIGKNVGIQVSKDMDVNGTARVMAWEDSCELGDAFGVSVLKPAKHGVVGVGWIFGTDTIAVGQDASVDSCGVAI